MLRDRFYNAVDELFEEIKESQDKSISDAAKICTEAIASGHTIHLYDTGHIIDSELFNRAGGFNLLRQFKYNLNLTSTANFSSIWTLPLATEKAPPNSIRSTASLNFWYFGPNTTGKP